MRREIEQLIAAWRNERAEEERIFADILGALEGSSRHRRAWMDELADALRGYGSAATPPPMDTSRFSSDELTQAIHSARQRIPN